MSSKDGLCVQITDGRWPGVFAIVEEERPWGVVANMIGPSHDRGKGVDLYPVRIPDGQYQIVGVPPMVFTLREDAFEENEAKPRPSAVMTPIIRTADEVREEERTRVLRILSDVMEACEKKRKDHHALPWLRAVRDAVESGAEVGVVAP